MTISQGPSHSTSAFRGIDIPNYDVIANCMHCGLCLPHCPTYALTGLEKSSPRGRIRLIKAVADGELSITDTFVDEMNFCLDCQACQTACPAGVKYGSLVEAARVQIFEQGYDSLLSKILKRVLLDWLFRKRQRLHGVANLLKIFESSGLKRIIQKTGILALFSKKLEALPSLAPSVKKPFSSNVLAPLITPKERAQFRVGFLTGCIMDVAYGDVNLDTVELLLQHDCEVVIPLDQGCCGSIQAHSGDLSTARRFAKKNVDAFERENLDVIIMNSAGCGAFMKEYGHIFPDDPDYVMRGNVLARKVKDITEFLHEIGFRASNQPAKQPSVNKDISLRNKRVTYHDACHLVHSQGVFDQPRQLIKSVAGIEFVEMAESTWCCGSAGTYNIARFDDSMKLLERKMENIRKIRPDIIVTGNPGCLAQLKYGLEKEGMNIDLLHTATFLRRASEAL